MSADSANLKMYTSSSSPILLILMSLIFTVNLTSTNTTEGIVKFIICVVLLVVLPYMYSKICVPEGPINSELYGLGCVIRTSGSFSVTFVIIVIAMLVMLVINSKIDS